MEQKLIARDRECSMLRDCMESDRSEFVIVYGRRRVGKTFLIDQYFKMNYDFSFVGSHSSTQRVQLRNFGKAMKQYAGLKTVPKYADWFDAFDALEEHLSNLPAKKLLKSTEIESFLLLFDFFLLSLQRFSAFTLLGDCRFKRLSENRTAHAVLRETKSSDGVERGGQHRKSRKAIPPEVGSGE